MQTVHAIFENGVFRPTEPVNLPDKAKVEFEPRVVAESPKKAIRRKPIEFCREAMIRDIMTRRLATTSTSHEILLNPQDDAR